ncbi:thyroid receptor-interacting protein 11-like isoform X2 [Phymastichus coffea]|uniref:thyroid receptor-interacting protein 11-like isoform X2 n=1 Tax=Phymastichus coffea TaxID=108790 RepID=UPI00273BA341|nr:thyroid receptor-interacting protein 11-like isoform X2 [Phymastichus coffea]
MCARVTLRSHIADITCTALRKNNGLRCYVRKNNGSQDEDAGAFFWDPPPASRSRETKAQAQTKLLQNQLDQATVKIRDLEAELNRVQTLMLNSSNVKDDLHLKDEGLLQKAELLRAKQDVMNRIIQMGEKSREVERNTKRLQQDELTLVSDFRTAISKLASSEQYDLIRSALLALENENQQFCEEEKEKSDAGRFDAKGKKASENDRQIELHRRIAELEEENRSLTASMEELDVQNAESIDRILTLKEDLQKKHQSLQKAYEQLYVDYNQALSTIENLKQEMSQFKFSNALEKDSVDCSVQTLVHQKVDKETEIILIKEDKETEANFLQEREQIDTILLKEDKEIETDLNFEDYIGVQDEIIKVKDILKNVILEPSDNERDEPIFINLAQKYVDLQWKKDALERKLAEQSRELKESQDMRESLQVDYEDMQANMESLLLQIQHLKSNLPSIPEASEERVASLETETESLQEEIQTLRKSNLEMTSELKAIRAAIKESGSHVDLDKIEALLESKLKNNESKDASDLLQITLDENTALRRRIDVLESELRVSLERCKGLDENIELIEELKLDLENVRRELKIALSNNKRLENVLSIAQEAKNEADADNEILSREKEQLEADLKLLRESDLNRNDGTTLGELHEELKKAREENNDLEYDIKNMRNELDQTIEQLEIIKTENEKMSLHSERLIRENNKLLDQFTETQNESLDKIELLNTEMSLLQQDLESSKEELLLANKNLNEAEQKISALTDINNELNDQLQNLKNVQNEKLMLKKELDEMLLQKSINNSRNELDSVLKQLQELEKKLLICENQNKQLQNELQRTENINMENQKLRKEIEEKQLEIMKVEQAVEAMGTQSKCNENYIATLEDENRILEGKLIQMDILQQEYDKSNKEIEELKQQLDLVERQKEIEINTQKELISRYQNEMDTLKTFESENKKLKAEFEKLLVPKCNVEVNTENLLIEQTSPTGTEAFNQDRTCLISELAEQSKEIQNLKAIIAKDKESALMARETVENLSQLISSKDNEIIKMNSCYDTLKCERDELIKLVQDKHNESLQYHSEIQRLTQLLNEQTIKTQKLIAERDANSAAYDAKESQLLWTQNELQVVKQRIQNIEETNNHGERCGIAEHTLLSKQVMVLEEKNKTLEAVILQDQSNIKYLQEQLADLQTRETSLQKDIERLRNHLVEKEASHTEEALQSEEILKTLEIKLMQAEEKLKNSSTMYTSVSVRANQQVETLQQQLALIVQQRDELQNKISATEDKVLSYSASLTNLQLVLEQFQRDKEKDIQAATEKLQIQLFESSRRHDELTKQILYLQGQLSEAQDCLKAATRLTEQLNKKSERIEQLNQEVIRLTKLVETADQRIQESQKSGEGKVDRFLIKNLLVGYISSPPNDKTAVLRVFANVLDFNEMEREKTGLNTSSAKNSWFSSMINSSPTPTKEQETSLSSAFIKFLESESQPKPQLPPLPISNSPISRPGHSRQHSSSSTQSALLLSNVTLPTFPDFVPARNTGSILKEVLKDS